MIVIRSPISPPCSCLLYAPFLFLSIRALTSNPGLLETFIVVHILTDLYLPRLTPPFSFGGLYQPRRDEDAKAHARAKGRSSRVRSEEAQETEQRVQSHVGIAGVYSHSLAVS